MIAIDCGHQTTSPILKINQKKIIDAFKKLKQSSVTTTTENDYGKIIWEIYNYIYQYHQYQYTLILNKSKSKSKTKIINDKCRHEHEYKHEHGYITQEDIYYYFQNNNNSILISLVDISDALSYLIDHNYIIENCINCEFESIQIPSVFWEMTEDRESMKKELKENSSFLLRLSNQNNENTNTNKLSLSKINQQDDFQSDVIDIINMTTTTTMTIEEKEKEKNDTLDDNNDYEKENDYDHDKDDNEDCYKSPYLINDDMKIIFEYIISQGKNVKISRNILYEYFENCDRNTINFALDYLKFIDHLI
jgi:hypothetical protein